MNQDLSKFKCLSGSALKTIAVISMTIDHVALYVMAEHLDMQELWSYDVLRGVGRMAFPIFAFLVVEGFIYSHNVIRYMATLFMTAVVSEAPWLLLGQTSRHNVLFTLLFGLIAINQTDKIKKKSWLVVLPSCLIAAIATWINTDYSWHGIGLMMIFYLFRGKPSFCFLFGVPFLLEYGVIGTALGILTCLAYNGKRGFIKGKWTKYVFYLYYPLHLLIIWLIKQ